MATFSGIWSTSADMRETGDAYVVEAELPGIKRREIDVEVSGRELDITGAQSPNPSRQAVSWSAPTATR